MCPGLQKSLDRLSRYAATDEIVLLQGETGTGKTRLARWLHEKSGRRNAPFHVVNLAASDDLLAGGELFGHVPGAYTDARGQRPGAFATAARGTLLLDEIGKSSLAVQRKLLNVMERRLFRPLGSDRDVPLTARLVFAASEPFEELVAAGAMLRDLVPRLGFFRVCVPPLRERPEDVPPLLRHFVRLHSTSLNSGRERVSHVDESLLRALAGYPWPDNVRELENLVRRLLIEAAPSGVLHADLLRDDLVMFDQRESVNEGRRERRARQVRDAIERNGGNHTRAARELRMSRSRVYDYERMLRSGEIRLSS